MTIREAAIAGTSEVAGAVIASTLTTIVVFLPVSIYMALLENCLKIRPGR